MNKSKNRKLWIFSSFQKENQVEYARRAKLSPSQRLKEFGQIQVRTWGKKWTSTPMVRTLKIERLPWYP